MFIEITYYLIENKNSSAKASTSNRKMDKLLGSRIESSLIETTKVVFSFSMEAVVKAALQKFLSKWGNKFYID